MALDDGITRISGDLPRAGYLETLKTVLLYLQAQRTNVRRLELMEGITRPERVYVCLEVDVARTSPQATELQQHLCHLSSDVAPVTGDPPRPGDG